MTKSFETTIIDITKENIDDHPQVVCFINKKHPTHHLKHEWILKRFKDGLKIKLLFIEEEKKPVGYIEYIPGEQAWRAVDAPDHMFIHCLWTNGKKYQHQGLGTLLLDACEKDAQSKAGVAVITSDGAFMAHKDIFIKNGFTEIAQQGKDMLLSKTYKKKAQQVSFKDHEKQLKKLNGFHILYSKQCPWVARFIQEIDESIIEKYNIKIKEFTTAKQAQNAPSIYSIFNLIYDGKILADRYISNTRFNNILKKLKL